MVDINKIFDFHDKIDEIERRKQLFDKLDKSSLSVFDQQRDSINELRRHSIKDLHNPVQDLRNNLLDLRSPVKDLRNSLLDINKPSKLFDDLRFAEKSINKSFSENLRDFQSPSLKIAKSLVEETFSPFSTNNLFSEKVKNDFDQLRGSLSSPFQTKDSELLRRSEQLTRATTLSSFEALSKSFSDNNLLGNENLLKQASSSLLNYDRFANNTLAKLSLETDKSIVSALTGSLTLANEQMLRSTSIAQSYIENSDIFSFDKSNLFFDREFPKVNRYRIQKQELLERDDIEEDEDYESLVMKSPSAISFELISSCMSLIVLCNEATRILKGEDIFTLTNTFFEATWKLPTIIPTNKDNFAILVDSLYFILVEGAGKDFLRFVDYKDGKHSGYFNNTESEVEVIWKIKHLRNKWLRHDIEHGKDTKKDYKIRKETLEWFGLQKVPQSKAEFIFLYNNLIFKVEEFLKLLFERVSKFSN